MSTKIIVSTAALYKYLSSVLEFNAPEMKLKIGNKEMQINGFRYLDCEHKEQLETEVSVEKLRLLRKVLSTVTDQPITLWVGHDEFTIQHLII